MKACKYCKLDNGLHLGSCPIEKAKGIEKVYSAPIYNKDKCRCGCSGNYFYTKDKLSYVAKVLDLLAKAEKSETEHSDFFGGFDMTSFDTDTRTYTIYSNPTKA
jgi:hypothetical protein